MERDVQRAHILSTCILDAMQREVIIKRGVSCRVLSNVEIIEH
jgi:hypothetical protein